MGSISSSQDLYDVDLSEQLEDTESIGEAADCWVCLALEEECGDLRAERYSLQRKVEELELKLQLNEETHEQMNLCMEKQVSELVTENHSLRAEVQDLQAAHTSDRSKMQEEFGKQITALEDQLRNEILVTEHKFIQANSELSQMTAEIFEKARKQFELAIEDQIAEMAAETRRLKAEVQELEEKLITDNAETIKECEQYVAGMQDQFLGQILNIECNYIHMDNECSQMKEEIVFYEEARKQFEHAIEDQIAELSVQSQRLITDMHVVQKKNLTESCALRNEVRGHIDGFEKQVLGEMKDAEFKFSSVNDELVQVTEQLSVQRQREDAAIRDMEERVAALTSDVAAKRRRGPRWWPFRSSRKMVSIIYPTLNV
jgi:chromosome segregation ATPase